MKLTIIVNHRDTELTADGSLVMAVELIYVV
jgi:hypothetical protein